MHSLTCNLAFKITHLSDRFLSVSTRLSTELAYVIEIVISSQQPTFLPIWVKLLVPRILDVFHFFIGGESFPKTCLFGHLNLEFGPARLKVINVLVGQMHRRLYLDKCSKLAGIVSEIVITVSVLLDECMYSAHADICHPKIIVSPAPDAD
jgi:hypothetical protein